MPARADQPRKRPQQTRAKETKARILVAAAALFGERGIAATSTNKIAADAGMSIGTLYRYFPDRDEIVKELTDGLFLQVEERYSRLLTVSVADRTPRDAVAEIIRIGVEILVANGPLVRALVADLQFLGSGIPEFEPRLRMLIKLYLIQVMGPTRGLDIDTMAYILLNAGFSTALRSVRMEEEGMDREFVIDQTADMIALWITTLAQVGSHDLALGPKNAAFDNDHSSGNGQPFSIR
ncbi:TetR/AcrR family transcriptional regulator [Nocardia fluminea]|uniref:TetR family transcriptional regulator n=1 Tax=Nocardia fluminea TaxID=134984 RepID=A0A2N3VHS6_9NOCA|nr:TetR/AcrR family transcriptional regulator [Nocardia fluminea]PKV81170.1 TetR family transcriptional regulator [Nocardia fluminea]